MHVFCDFAADLWRHLMENFFCVLKTFRRVATRYDESDQRFATIHLAAIAPALK